MKKRTELTFAALFAIATLLPVIYFHNNNTLTTMLVAIVSLLGLLFWRKKSNLFIFIFAGIFGPLAEITCISNGAWTYSNPNFMNIPVWLLFVWGNTGQFMYNVGLIIKKVIKE